MKKNILFLCIIFSTSLVSAQFRKGSLFLGGDIGGSSLKQNSSNNTSSTQNGISIAPVFGKAIRTNLFVGVEARLTFLKNRFSSGPNNDQRQNSYGGGLFIRKYKQVGKGGFSLFLHGRLGGDYYKTEYAYTTPNADRARTYNIGMSAYPGVSYAVSKRFQIESGFNNVVSLSYTHEKRVILGAIPTTYKTSLINLSSSLNNLASFYVGFRVLFSKWSPFHE